MGRRRLPSKLLIRFHQRTLVRRAPDFIKISLGNPMSRERGMTRRLTTVVAFTVLLAFIALRIYGAYHRERVDALARAAAAEQQGRRLDEQAKQAKQQMNCNGLWTEYQIAVLKGKIVDEPPCSGHAPRPDEIVGLGSSALEALEAAHNAWDSAKWERAYASSRKYQTRYLALRVWGFITGTPPSVNPAELVRSAALSECTQNAKDDAGRKECEEFLESPAHNP